ncbi:MAG: glutathione synthase [Candidatus Binatia bacterium]
MKFLHVMDPIEGIDITLDTSFLFLSEAQNRGHENYYCGIQQLSFSAGTRASCAPLRVRPVQGEHHAVGEYADHAAEDFDAVFMRKDPPFDTDFFFATHLLSLVNAGRTFVFNNPTALREINEKLSILKFPDLIAETIVSADISRIIDFVNEVGGDIVVKPLDGCGGQGIFRIRRGDLNTRSILETSTFGGKRQIMAQRFLPESREGDLRLIYLDGRAAGAIRRVPCDDDLRGNLHVGGSAVKAEVGPREIEICEALTPLLSELGIYFAGLDVIGGCLTEINVTSPTGVQEIDRLCGLKLEAEVIDLVERKVGELDR